MVASLFVAFSCVNCVPMDAEEPIAFKSNYQVSSYSTASNYEPVSNSSLTSIANRKQERFTADYSRRAFEGSKWAVGEGMAEYRASLDISPEALKVATHEVYAGEWKFEAPLDKAGFDLDLSVAPHAKIEKTASHESRRTGAEVRIGQIADRLDQRGQNVRVDSWYMFIGTDNEALCWDMGDRGGVALRDQVTVGDWQAGVAFHKAGGELSVGVLRRETNFEQFKTVSNIAAVTFTMHR